MENKKGPNETERALYSEMPLGLSSALARNVGAMRAFSQMSQEQRISVIEGAKNVHSKAEMRSYVAALTKNNDTSGNR